MAAETVNTISSNKISISITIAYSVSSNTMVHSLHRHCDKKYTSVVAMINFLIHIIFHIICHNFSNASVVCT